MPKTLVVFHYFEADENYQKNLRYFLDNGYRHDLDYVVVLAGGCSVDLPQVDNIRYVYIPNNQFDFGGFAHVVRHTLVDDLHRYKYFVFINCSVRGPFLPTYWKGSWTEPLLNLLVGDVRLAGSTICIPRPGAEWSDKFKARHGGVEPYSHVQSMAYAMDRSTLEFLIQNGFYERAIGGDKDAAILDYEILLSQLILRNGWKISCLLPEYQAIDYRLPHSDINPTSGDGDPSFVGGYFGRSPHPFETLFVKTNRNVIDQKLLSHLESTQSAGQRESRSAYLANAREPILAGIVTAWKAHKNFAIWLSQRLDARAVADLGVDFGYSTFCFALGTGGTVWGIDSFEGDEHTGTRNTMPEVLDNIQRLTLPNVLIVKGFFEDVAKTWDKELDILHIDGLHTYDAVRADYLSWIKFVKAPGAVLFHNTCVPHFGVRRLFDEIQAPKTNLAVAHGLGIVSRDRDLIVEVASKFERLIEPGSTFV